MQSFKKWIKRTFAPLFRLRDCLQTIKGDYYLPMKHSRYGSFGKGAIIQVPCSICKPELIHIGERGMIRRGFSFDGTEARFIFKKYSISGRNLSVVTGNHTKTVGLPISLVATWHINEKSAEVVVEEDVWLGANCILLPGAHIGRGSIIGANSLVNKEIPPYAVAVGSPSRIIRTSLSIEQILRHESILYPPDERYSKAELESLFAEYYSDKKGVGADNLSDEDIHKYLDKFSNIFS